MADQDIDQTEEATPHKRDEARKKGSVAKSADVVAVAMLGAAVVTLNGSGWDMLVRTARLQQTALAAGMRQQWTVASAAPWLADLLRSAVEVLGPLFLCLAVMAVLANLAQTGPIFSLHPLKPDLDKLNPANGLRRLLSMRTLFEGAKSIVKLALLAGLMFALIRADLPGLASLAAVPAKSYLRVLLGLCASMLVKLVLALLLVAALDWLFTRRDFAKRLRMSKREVKDEVKNREGDPRIRGRLRDLRRDMLKRSQSVSKVAQADVLITNPTRLAVAVRYEQGGASAPQVVAKGAGEVARSMRELAARHRIPVVQNRALARVLFREVDFDGFVPEKLYPQLAKIMVWVFSLRRQQRLNER